MDPGDKIEVVRLSRPKEFRAYGLLQSVDDGGGVVLEGDSRIFNSVHYGFTVIGQFPWTSSVPGDKPGVKIMNERSETEQPETIEGIDAEIDKLKSERITLVADRREELYRKLRTGAYGISKDGRNFVITRDHCLITKNYSNVPCESKDTKVSISMESNDEILIEWASPINGYLFDDLKERN